MRQVTFNIKSSFALLSSAALLLTALTLQTSHVSAQANSCSTLSDAKGRADYTAQGVDTGTYTVWSRVKATSGSKAEYKLSIDGAGGSYCDKTVSTAVSGTDWKWVKNADTLNWSSGDMRFQMAGTIDGVGLDCVVLRTDNVDLSSSGKEGCDENYEAGSGGGGGGGTVGNCGTVEYDVNGNGAVNALDAGQTYSKIEETGETTLCKYDVTRDGKISVTDARKVYSQIAR